MKFLVKMARGLVVLLATLLMFPSMSVSMAADKADPRCDIDLSFRSAASNDGVLVINRPTAIRIIAKNVGDGRCPQLNLKLLRYKGRQGWVEGDLHTLAALRPGQSRQLTWSVSARQAGNYVYRPRFVGGFSDRNLSNHQPEKKYKAVLVEG